MKKYIVLTFLAFGLFKAEAQTLPTLKDSVSYAMGADLAKMLKRTGFEVDLSRFMQAFTESYNDRPTLFSESENSSIIQKGLSKAAEEQAAKARKSGEDFLAANKTQPNIQSTPEGIQYQVLIQGQGEQPAQTDEVLVHYAGYLIDGKKFDSSYDRGEPLTLSLNNVIEGWKIGIPLMKKGSKYKFFIPENLAYGARATGEIPAYSTLVFEVELLDIKPKDEASQIR